ncbi:MAG: hypothetical protein ABJC89_16620, partial [Acidobacteriota bacterium]
MSSRSRVSLASALGLLLAPQIADACPICFGAADSPLLDAARIGVIAMAGVTLIVLSAFARWFLKLRRLEHLSMLSEPPASSAMSGFSQTASRSSVVSGFSQTASRSSVVSGFSRTAPQPPVGSGFSG